jgi:hypothetical protein
MNSIYVTYVPDTGVQPGGFPRHTEWWTDRETCASEDRSFLPTGGDFCVRRTQRAKLRQEAEGLPLSERALHIVRGLLLLQRLSYELPHPKHPHSLWVSTVLLPHSR